MEDLNAPVPRERPERLDNLVDLVAQMELMRPEALRVTLAVQALQGCGRVFRPRLQQDPFEKSFVSEKVSCFWSHSWHGGQYKKVATLLTLYNGLPAILCGLLAALVMMVLFTFGSLPGFQRVPDSPSDHSAWSLGMGFLVTAIAFVFWRPQQHVFLDRICITESDPELKAEQILSLAGMLKRSREMLVLWDSSWSDRLWCLFELSAFLKSKADSEHSRLLVTPTFMGPCVVATFIGNLVAVVPMTFFPLSVSDDTADLIPMVFVCVFGAVGALCCAHAFRSYFQSVDDLKEKLQSVSLEKTRSFCCEVNHEGDLMCDREIVQDCITTWFGSQEAFEDSVRSEVLQTLVFELEWSVFTRPWRIAVSIPFLWASMDLAASDAKTQQWLVAINWLLSGLTIWLLACPLNIENLANLAHRFRARQPTAGREALMDVLVLLLALPLFLFGVALAFLTGFFLPESQPPLLQATFWGLLELAVLLKRTRCSSSKAPEPSMGHLF
ncbi:Uncharacterized protein SCF082_LOCUS29093 [Durusdinium trenchii]|uniref:Transmembrane protein n=1 Tax=Durusdinium trenchii TaxID=1381693 RepID=A0ABP0MN42_9DINO